MVQSAYPFIDIAVLDPVRGPMLAGDAVVVLDASLETIIWANGPGAVLFGHDDVESARGADASLGMAARRQIAATPGFPRIGPGRSLLVRLPQGLGSVAIGFVASQAMLPDGEIAIVLAAPDAKAESRSAADKGARAIHGIAQDGQHAALIGPRGEIIAQSADFSQIGVSAETLAALAADVALETDRLAKRLVRANGRSFPAGVALLGDDPLRALVIVVEDAQADEPARPFGTLPGNTADTAMAAVAAQGEDNWRFVDRRAAAREAAQPVETDAGETPRPDEPEVERQDAAQPAAPGAPEQMREAAAGIEPADQDDNGIDGFEPFEAALPDEIVETVEPFEMEDPAGWRAAEAPPAAEDDDEAGGAEALDDETPPADDKPTPASPTQPQSPPVDDAPAGFTADPNAAPVRFVWKTDAEGRISALSAEFATAVGDAAADVVGQKFRNVAERFALDPDGEIAGLLERRDTWSGRSVLWPVAGTDLKAPVDLAALPVYGRDRNFEGFRGFGVVRAGDAVVDPDAIGLDLGGRAASAGAADDRQSPAAGTGTTPGGRADKVIQLAEHRQTPPERSLSSTESNAFREIAARLREADKQPPAAANGNAGATQETAVDAPAEAESLPDEPLTADSAAEQAPTPWYDEDDQFGDDWTEAERDADEDAPEAGADDETDADDAAHDSAALLERLPVPVLVHTGDALLYANDEFFKLTGYRSLADLEAAGGIDALFAEDDGGRPADDHRRRLRTRDGREFPVEALLQSAPWNGGKALLLALKADAEPQAAVAAPQVDEAGELDLRLEEMRAILDTATDGIIIITNEGSIRSVSRPAEALFGFDGFELVGKPFVSLFAVESQRAARDYLSGLSDNGVASVLNDGREVIGREAKGRFIPLFMTIGKLPGGNGYCAVLRDITQWKRAEEELTQARAEAERSSGQKTEFLARISHEIRTPLNAIIGFSELMIDEKFGPIVNERYKDYLRDINRSGNHVLDLVNDLLDISKIEAGEQEMAHEAVSLNESLAEAVAMMQPQANRERVIIRSSFASRLPEVVADERSIRQIALNLLSNAVRFTQAGGQVIVSTSYENTGDVVMRVRDTGVGMSQSEIEQALKPFKQINALKRPRGDGTGLGLPLTKAMVEANRARFSIHSTPGEGTMVEITFPSTRVLAG